MIEYTARKISIQINKVAPESNVNVMAYSIGMKLNFYSIIILTVCIGTLTGHLFESCIAMVGCATLRRFSGGKHLALTPCMIVSVSLFTMSPLLPISSLVMVLLTCLTIFILAFYSKKSANQKTLSLALVIANLFISSSVLALVFAVQAASLIERKGVRKNDGKTY